MTGPRPLPTMTQEHEDELRLLAWDARAEGNMVQHKLLVETADFIEAAAQQVHAHLHALESEIGELKRAAAPTPPREDAELLGAVRVMLEGFDNGVFVRSTQDDADPAWSLKLLPYIKALATLNVAARAPSPGDQK